MSSRKATESSVSIT